MTKLGLPNGVRACLFDLDGVLTRTAVVHAAAWKEMFDDVPAATRGRRLPPVRRGRRLRRVRRRPPARRRGAHLPGLPRHRAARGRGRRPARTRTPCTASATARTTSCWRRSATEGVEAYPGSVRYRARRCAAAGLRTAVVSSSANCRDVLVAAGIEDLFDVRIDGVVAAERGAAGQAAPGHLPGRRPRPRRRRRGAPPSSRTPWPAWRPGRAGRLRLRRRRRPRRARPTRCADTAPTSWSATSPSCWRTSRVITDPLVRRRALGAARDRARPRRAGPERVASSRCPTATSAGAATSTRASRTACPAPTSTACTSCARCRTPRPATATRSPARPSSTSPTASSSGCWSTTSRSTCATAGCARHERVLDLRAGLLHRTCEWVSPAGQRGPGALHPAGLVHPAGGRRHRLRGRAARRRRCGWSSSPSWSPTSSCPSAAGDPRVAAALESPLEPEEHFADGTAAAAGAPHHGTAGCGSRRPPTTSSTGRRATTHARARAATDVSRLTVTSVLEPGAAAAAGEVRRLRLVRRPLAARRCATRSTPRWPAPRSTGWEGLRRRAARLPRRLLGPRRRRGRRRRRDPAGGAVRALPRAAGRRPRRAAGDPRQGPDRLRLRRPRLLGHRDLRAAGAHLHLARVRRRGAALAARHPARRAGAGRASSACDGAAFPWRTIDG